MFDELFGEVHEQEYFNQLELMELFKKEISSNINEIELESMHNDNMLSDTELFELFDIDKTNNKSNDE